MRAASTRRPICAKSLDIDSMDFLNFVTAIHHRLGIDIPGARLSQAVHAGKGDELPRSQAECAILVTMLAFLQTSIDVELRDRHRAPTLPAFPGCGAARSGAPPVRGPRARPLAIGPGSAAQHFAALRAALRPGHESEDGSARRPVGDAIFEQRIDGVFHGQCGGSEVLFILAESPSRVLLNQNHIGNISLPVSL